MADRSRRIWLRVPALALLALAGLLLWRGLDRDGVSAGAVTLPGGEGAKLFLPADSGPVPALSLPAEEGEEDHVHTLSLGGQLSAALVLRAPRDGADGLAVELARRGVAVLAAAPEDAGAAWGWLTGQGFARLSALALLGGEEALTLADALTGSGRESAAVILRGEEPLLERAASSPARNILFLTPGEPPMETVETFLGEPERKPGAIGGYFAEGTARRVIRRAGERWDGEETLLPVIDWLGSALGHSVELHDDDLILRERRELRTGAAVSAALGLCLAGGSLLPGKKRGENHDP